MPLAGTRRVILATSTWSGSFAVRATSGFVAFASIGGVESEAQVDGRGIAGTPTDTINPSRVHGFGVPHRRHHRAPIRAGGAVLSGKNRFAMSSKRRSIDQLPLPLARGPRHPSRPASRVETGPPRACHPEPARWRASRSHLTLSHRWVVPSIDRYPTHRDRIPLRNDLREPNAG
ncbi:MAG: hypothetical protein JWQ43_2608 [Glaciihabitans sp.]|nr:hypothetical protein [Glaciihabitans sp.]